jgi:hypothetical protein
VSSSGVTRARSRNATARRWEAVHVGCLEGGELRVVTKDACQVTEFRFVDGECCKAQRAALHFAAGPLTQEWSVCSESAISTFNSRRVLGESVVSQGAHPPPARFAKGRPKAALRPHAALSGSHIYARDETASARPSRTRKVPNSTPASPADPPKSALIYLRSRSLRAE